METMVDFIFLGSKSLWTVTSATKLKDTCFLEETSVQFSSVTQSCLTLRDTVDQSMPGLPVHHQLPGLFKLISIELVMPFNHLILCQPFSCLRSFLASESFQTSQLFATGGQSIGSSALTSVLPINIQD